MKLNELELDNYQSSDNKVTFVLKGEVLSDAVALDGQTLTVADGERQIAVFSGYEVVAVYLELGNTVVGCMRELDESTKLQKTVFVYGSYLLMRQTLSLLENVRTTRPLQTQSMCLSAMVIPLNPPRMNGGSQRKLSNKPI